jgi:hypothetical protein
LVSLNPPLAHTDLTSFTRQIAWLPNTNPLHKSCGGWCWELQCYSLLPYLSLSASVRNWHSSGMRLLQRDAPSVHIMFRYSIFCP